MNFEIPKKILDLMEIDCEYQATGWWNVDHWEWSLRKLGKEKKEIEK